jgi:hypothetical protein
VHWVHAAQDGEQWLALVNTVTKCAESEVLTAVVMKRSILWDIKPCSPLKVNRRFAETCLHLQGRKISQAEFATFFVVF